MSVIVERGTVDDGKQVYVPGDVITGLSKKDEQELVSSGVCRYAVDQEQEPKSDGLPEGLTEVSKGVYELPNGEKVKGKAKSIEALEAYNQELATSQSDDDDDDDDLDDDDQGGGPNTELPV